MIGGRVFNKINQKRRPDPCFYLKDCPSHFFSKDSKGKFKKPKIIQKITSFFIIKKFQWLQDSSMKLFLYSFELCSGLHHI